MSFLQGKRGAADTLIKAQNKEQSRGALERLGEFSVAFKTILQFGIAAAEVGLCFIFHPATNERRRSGQSYLKSGLCCVHNGMGGALGARPAFKCYDADSV
jgi:hypothetical protein